jgi:uncharacterized protein HemX
MQEHWHLDRRVPVAIIFAIALQSAGAIWWAASMSERMEQIEQRQQAAGARAEAADARQAEQGQRIAVLTEAVANTNRNLERLQGEISTTNQLLRDYLMRLPNGGER